MEKLTRKAEKLEAKWKKKSQLLVVESIFETVRQVLKKRHQTLAEADVVHSHACECGLRVPDGNGIGRVPARV